ncbi:MAG: hypothetical protein J0L87_05555 [Bacteroidetes bacterium]|nr:hypothetical protein [Bacteroidota bacterium]
MQTSTKLILSCFLILKASFSWAQFSTSAGNITQITSGNVGIGFPSYAPVSMFQVKNGSVLFDGSSGSTPTTGSGVRLMWIPSKFAIRAGQVTSSQWDPTNIGTWSVAFGYNTTASGSRSFAAGTTTTASGGGAFAFGGSTTASGNYSFAVGSQATSSGAISAAFGYSTNAQSYLSMVIGQFNQLSAGYNASTWIPTDPLFVVGNGTSAVATSNALTILKNGNIGVGTTLLTNTNNYKLTVAASSTGTNSGILVQTASGALYGIKQEVNDNTTKAFVIENAGIENFRVLGDGKVYAREVNIQLGTFPDYVFETDYKLMTLNELETYIHTNKHLPEIPSQKEVTANGADLGEMVILQMQKIEELTLYLIEQNKKIEQLEIKNDELKKAIEDLNK